VRRRIIFDTSVYIAVLRDESFATAFRPRYARDVPDTHFSSVVIQELVAGARTFQHRRQAALLYGPFERVGRVITPTHGVWKEAGALLAKAYDSLPGLRSKLAGGFVNDVLIALSARSIGAAVGTRNVEDFERIRELRSFHLEPI
jgi:predicted nucleic acid-binding protein